MENVKYPCLGRNLRSLRRRKGVTQRQLANILGVTNKAVSAWEVSYADPRSTMLNKISEYFGIAPELLCFHRLLNTADEDAVQEEMLTALPQEGVHEPFPPSPPAYAYVRHEEEVPEETPAAQEEAPRPQSTNPPAPRVRMADIPPDEPQTYVFAPRQEPRIIVQDAPPKAPPQIAPPLAYPDIYADRMAELMKELSEENKKKLIEKAHILLKLQMLEEFEKN